MSSNFDKKNISNTSGALRDAYEIYGDGVARAIPEKLFARDSFKKAIQEAFSVDLIEMYGSDSDK